MIQVRSPVNHKAITVNLRWLSILLAFGAVPVEALADFSRPWLIGPLALFAVSNLILMRLPEDRFGYHNAWFGLVCFDIAIISVASAHLVVDGGDSFFLYLPVVAWASCHHGPRGVMAATVMGVVADTLVMGLAGPSGRFTYQFLAQADHLIHISALLVVGVFFAYLAQRLKQQAEGRAALVEEHRDMANVLSATKEFTVSLKLEQVLGTLIQQVVELVGAFRCSVVHVDEAGAVGTILISREILANREDFGSRTLRISLDNYPELAEAVATGETVVINDIAATPALAPVAGQLKTIGIDALLVVPITVEDPVVGTLMLCLARKQNKFTGREARMAELIASVAAGAYKNAYMHESLASKNLSLKKLAVSDPLTGLYNRRFFDMRLSEEVRLASRHGLPLSVLMLDVDYFKPINDNHGHQVGDRVLMELGRVVPRSLRQSDCMARYGGEEFVILLPLTDLEGAVAKAEEVRLAVKELSFNVGGDDPLTITISCGAAQLDCAAGMTGEELVKAADDAVYKAKETGRDRVCAGEPVSAVQAVSDSSEPVSSSMASP